MKKRNSMTVLPNLIIAGAPKCGTTSLYTYLADHPQICAASEQETRYLIDPGYPLFNPEFNFGAQGLEGYEVFFEQYDPGKHRILLECTPDYLYQKLALDVIADMESKPNVLFLLRKPSRRIYSLYGFAQNNIGVVQQKTSFRQFLENVRSGNVPEKRVILAQALDQSYYAKHIRPWIDRLGSERVITLLFEDMVANPRQTLANISNRIGVSPDFFADYVFNQENQTISVKNQWIFSAIKSIRSRLPFLTYISSSVAPLRRWYHSAVVDTRKKAITAEDQDLLSQLDEEFRLKNKELSELVNIDIAPWG